MAHSLSAAQLTSPRADVSAPLTASAELSAGSLAGPRREPTMITRVGGLTPRPVAWPAWALAEAGAGVGCYAGAPLMHLDMLSVPGAVSATAAVVMTAYVGERGRRRRLLADQLTEAFTPLLGLRTPSRKSVKVSRWRGRWVGTPERVGLIYSRGSVNVEHPRWQQELLSIARRLLGEEYELGTHDRRRGKITLIRHHATASESVATIPAVQRATRTARELLGPTAVLEPVIADELDENDQLQLTAVLVRHQAGMRVATPAQRARIERVFSTMLPGRWRAHWQLEADTVRFELRPSLPTRVAHPSPTDRDDPDVLKNYDQVAIDYAVDEDGREVTWQPAIDPHLMVVGATGTGKTVLLHGVLTEIASWGWQVYVNDAKGVEFLGFREWPNVRAVATTTGEQVATIHAVWKIMEERYAAIVDGRAHETDFEPVVLFLDEFRDFYGNLTDWYSRVRVTGKGGDPTRAPVIEKVKSIARKGRTARVHLILGTQRPDSDWLGGEMRDNFRARVSLGRLSPQGSMMMWDSPSAAVSVPRGIRGRGVTLDHEDRIREIQTFWTPDPRKVRPDQTADLQTLLRLWPATCAHERLVILPPQVHEGAEDDEPRYRQWAEAFLQSRVDEGPASIEHLSHVARIVPLALHPEAAPRSTMSSASAAMLLDAGGPANTAGVANPHRQANASFDGASPTGHHGELGEEDEEEVGDYGPAVIVERDPAAARFVSLSTNPVSRRTRQARARHRAGSQTRGGFHHLDTSHPSTSTEDEAQRAGLPSGRSAGDIPITPPRETVGTYDRGTGRGTGRDTGMDDDIAAGTFDDAIDDALAAASADLDAFAGYGAPEDLTVDELEAGMLVLLDEDTDHWAVLEDDPQVDFDDEDLRCLDWRDDADQAGSLTVEADALVTVRPALDEPEDDPLDEIPEPSTSRRARTAPRDPRARASARRRGDGSARPSAEDPRSRLRVVR